MTLAPADSDLGRGIILPPTTPQALVDQKSQNQIGLIVFPWKFLKNCLIDFLVNRTCMRGQQYFAMNLHGYFSKIFSIITLSSVKLEYLQ